MSPATTQTTNYKREVFGKEAKKDRGWNESAPSARVSTASVDDVLKRQTLRVGKVQVHGHAELPRLREQLVEVGEASD